MYESVHEFLKMILHEWVLDICFYRTSGFKDWGYTNLNGQTYRSISRYIYIAFVTVCNATFYLSYLISSVSCILQYGKIAMTFLLSSTGWNVERHELKFKPIRGWKMTDLGLFSAVLGICLGVGIISYLNWA